MDENKTTEIQTSEEPVTTDDKKTEELENNKTEKAPVKKSKKGLFIFIILLIIALAVAAYFVFFKPKSPAAGTSAEIQQMTELTQEVQGMENEIKQKENQIFKNMNEYKDKTGGQSLGVNTLNLNDEEKKLLEQRIADEKDNSVKSLLQDILEKNKEIQDLKEQITEIEKKLPVPHVVKKGESHFKIAMDFLVNEKGVEKKRAQELIEKTALLDTLVPGFKIYNFYTGEEYGTAVTQGTAPVSPNTIIRQAKKQLVDARDEAISQRDQLATEIQELEAKRDEILSQLETLTQEKESLMGKVSELNLEVNSFYYLIDTEKNLKNSEILKGGFLRSTKLKDISPELFKKSMDLRANTQITISGAELGIEKIKSIAIFPKLFIENTDYSIEIAPDKLTATFTILSVPKFKNQRLVISIN